MRKIGELKGKPIVEGNPNEVKNNQIHAKTEGGGITLSERKNGNLETISGSSSGGGGKVEYYNIINEDKFNSITDISAFQMGCKHIIDGIKRVTSAMYVISGTDKIISISYYPTNIVFNDIEVLLSDNFYNAFYKFAKMVFIEVTDEQIKEFFNSTFAPITEEEFYNLD